MGGFGQAALKPIFEAVTEAVTGCVRWREFVLPTIIPRLITISASEFGAARIRIYSDATGDRALASMSFPPEDGRQLPPLLSARADAELHDVAAKSNKPYILQPRRELWGRNVILIVGDKAACAALSGSAARDRVAPTLVYTLWAIAAQYDISIRTRRVPTGAAPAGPQPRNREL